jgi:asparagine synthase (glutamine-hydrolysing)
MEKYLIREAYKNMYLLPNEVLFRKKEAFSDGVSNQGKSLYQIIQEHVNNMPEYSSRTDLTIKEKEKAYYKDLFLSYYPDCEDILPYYWMPKYILSDDPSARTLATYSNNK